MVLDHNLQIKIDDKEKRNDTECRDKLESWEKLEEIMEFISDSGAEPITRSTSAEICIDWTYGIIKENMNKVNLEGISFHKEKDI